MKARKIHCSFCGKSQDEVATMVAGAVNVAICDECVRIAVAAVDERAVPVDRIVQPQPSLARSAEAFDPCI